MVILLSLVLAMSLFLAACGSDTTSAGSPSSELDRSDVEEVAVAMVTAFLESDYRTLGDLVLPDQRESVDTIEQAAELGRAPDVKIVSVTATIVEHADETATVEYAGEYCLPKTTTEVPVTAAGSDLDGVETVPGSGVIVEEPERCFDLDELLQSDRVEFQLIDGAWYGPLPA